MRFFVLQDYPLTLLELQRFLVADWEHLKPLIDEQGEIKIIEGHSQNTETTIDQILSCLDSELVAEVESLSGFYCLKGRSDIIKARLSNYAYGIKREKLIRRYIGGLKYLPFVRGVALAGSQALGQQRKGSDIDLIVVTHPKFLWLTRTLVTGYFQVLGLRRHGSKVADRFCLNHYLAGPKLITDLRNFYTAGEYLKLRPLLYQHSIWAFEKINLPWLNSFFPNALLLETFSQEQKGTQAFLEKLFENNFGTFLEKTLKNWQLPKIRMEKFIVVEEDELSFHPDSKQQGLLSAFAKFQKQQ